MKLFASSTILWLFAVLAFIASAEFLSVQHKFGQRKLQDEEVPTEEAPQVIQTVVALN